MRKRLHGCGGPRSARPTLRSLYVVLRGASLVFVFLLAVGLALGQQSPAPWSTYRGNAQRTGNTDGQAGPAIAKVLWVHKSKDNYVAAPVPLGNRLVLSGLGPFNIGTLACLSTEPEVKERVRWIKTTPLLKLPTVSSPAIVEQSRLVLGDGMHQTNGATLYCLDGDDGTPLWRLPVPGDLVHLEGSPTVVDGKAYLGGGSAGVLCVEAVKAKVVDKALDLYALQKLMTGRWQELQKKYEVDRKKDEFAVPPSEDQLPAAEPTRLWQQGKDKWHVDAPVAVVGNRVLAASAFLNREKLGNRRVFCMDRATGAEKWASEMKLNPWGGPSVDGGTVVVTGSSIGYDTKALKGARGLIAAFDVETGKKRWSKEITGGVLGCAALAGGSAVVTSTDGKVRAFDIASGERQWIYEAKAPMFAPVAIAQDVVYVGDLRGVVHAVELKNGQPRWQLDLGKAAEVQAPGMIYGGPIIHGGRLYVATCNLEGPNSGQTTAIVCIGEK